MNLGNWSVLLIFKSLLYQNSRALVNSDSVCYKVSETRTRKKGQRDRGASAQLRMEG